LLLHQIDRQRPKGRPVLHRSSNLFGEGGLGDRLPVRAIVLLRLSSEVCVLREVWKFSEPSACWLQRSTYSPISQQRAARPSPGLSVRAEDANLLELPSCIHTHRLLVPGRREESYVRLGRDEQR
jgi:hypothetical protein